MLQTTVAPVKTRALKFVQQWTKQFGSDPSIGVMQELYDSLKARKMFDTVDDAPKASVGAVDADEERRERLRREEEEQLARVLELSKQDKGGRSAAENKPATEGSPAGPSGIARSSNAVAYPEPKAPSAAAPQPFIARDPTPPPVAPSKATAARVRAIYPFTTSERGELSFEKGDVIKVIDRMYDEWYTGAVGGRIGIFPVSYVVSHNQIDWPDDILIQM
jgi:signal transducing adaptor molecule